MKFVTGVKCTYLEMTPAELKQAYPNAWRNGFSLNQKIDFMNDPLYICRVSDQGMIEVGYASDPWMVY